MQILFLDESGTAPASNAVGKNPYFVLGGLVVPEAQWKSLQRDLRRLKAEYGVRGEVKWRYFFPPSPQQQGNAAFASKRSEARRAAHAPVRCGRQL
ncbi:DUF3800 domain-containing protein [Bifidobacterium dentium]|uniref:DUF3800 domain-containing protein n=1 Tax=Bifidobacterium dentium TaxID=1689 RepID=UPI003D175E1A